MSFDFHRAQARARRRSWVLRALLGVLIAATAAGIAVFVWSVFEAARGEMTRLDPVREGVAVVSVLAGVAMAVASVRTFVQEREILLSGQRVAAMLRATEVAPRPWSEGERVLRNVTEEAAVAAGLPAPRLYVVPGQPGINALAVGPDVAHGAVFVSDAAVESLSRPALQAVVAHEIAHLAVGDAALHAVSGAASAALMTAPRALSQTLRAVLGVLDEADGVPLAEAAITIGVVGLSTLVAPLLVVPGVLTALVPVLIGLPTLAACGWLASYLLDRAVSHQTEYGADALAVELTRDPDGLADALRALRDTALRGLMVHVPTDRLQPFFFARPFPVPAFSEGMFQSHPTPEKRIARLRTLDPGRWRAGRLRPLAPPAGADRAPVRGAATPGAAPGASPMAAAGTLLDALPETLRDAAHRPRLAEALVYALLLHPAPELRLRQRYLLRDHAEDALRLFDDVVRLPRAARLPLAEIALPAVRRLGRPAAARILATADRLVLSDGRLSVPELVMCEALRHSLSPAPTPRPASSERAVAAAAPVLSMVAHAGGPTLAEREGAYAAGLRELARHVPGTAAPLRVPDRCAFREALHTLAASDASARDAVLRAARAAALADGRTTDAEADLVRLLALAVGQPCPLSPPASTLPRPGEVSERIAVPA